MTPDVNATPFPTSERSKPRIHFLSAGAGSGKTYRVTEILKSRLEDGRLKPGGILATTFTRRAAAELRERVRGHLLKGGAYALANAVAEAQIGTVNAVCGNLVQRFSFEMGLSPDLRVLEEKEALRLLSESLDRIIEAEERRELSDLAWRLSVEDVSHVVRDLVQLARANGLQTVELIEMGSANANAQVELMCRPSAEDVGERLIATIARHLPTLQEALDAPKPKQNTQKYLAAVQRFAEQIKDHLPPWVDWARVAAHDPPEAALRDITAEITEAAERFDQHPQFAADIRRYLELVFALAARAMHDFAEQKAREGVIDFVDQEALLLQNIEHPLVQEALRDELQLVVVDEFQDTSPLQLAIFLKLAEIAPESIWVGDIKQAIYGFRGTDTRLMQAVIAALPELGGDIERMSDSWRSRPALVALCNRVYAHAFSDTLAPVDVELNPRREERLAEAPVYEVWHLNERNKDLRYGALVQQLKVLHGSGRPIIDKATGKPRPMSWKDIAVLVNQKKAIGELAQTMRNLGVPCAVETYGLLAQAESVLALACLRRLYDPRDTLATAEIFSLAACEPAEQWLARRLEWLQQTREKPELGHRWGELDQPGQPAHPLLVSIAAMRPKLDALTPREALSNLMAVGDLGKVVTGWSPNPDQASARLANLDVLLELAGRYEDECTQRDAPGSIPGFLFWLDQLEADQQDVQARPDSDAVTVMTHHGAKGLEWPVVVLMDLGAEIKDDLWEIRGEQKGLLEIRQPLANRFLRYWVYPFGKMEKVSALKRVEGSPAGTASTQRALEERRRLLYVSMTRARDLLIFAVEKTDFDKLPWLAKTTECRDLLHNMQSAEAVLPSEWGIGSRFTMVKLPEDGQARPPASVAEARFWPTRPIPINERLPLFANPSSAAPLPAVILAEHRIATPLPLSAAGRANEAGSAIHAALAYGLSTSGQPQLEVLRALVERLHCSQLISAEALERLITETRKGLEALWPGARTTAEVPFAVTRPNGQIIRGQIDLVLMANGETHIIDHKSGQLETAGGHDKWDQYLGQLDSYAGLINGGQSVGRWLYALRSGGLVQLGAGAGEET